MLGAGGGRIGAQDGVKCQAPHQPHARFEGAPNGRFFRMRVLLRRLRKSMKRPRWRRMANSLGSRLRWLPAPAHSNSGSAAATLCLGTTAGSGSPARPPPGFSPWRVRAGLAECGRRHAQARTKTSRDRQSSRPQAPPPRPFLLGQEQTHRVCRFLRVARRAQAGARPLDTAHSRLRGPFQTRVGARRRSAPPSIGRLGSSRPACRRPGR